MVSDEADEGTVRTSVDALQDMYAQAAQSRASSLATEEICNKLDNKLMRWRARETQRRK
jgi:hypothetical protein